MLNPKGYTDAKVPDRTPAVTSSLQQGELLLLMLTPILLAVKCLILLLLTALWAALLLFWSIFWLFVLSHKHECRPLTFMLLTYPEAIKRKMFSLGLLCELLVVWTIELLSFSWIMMINQVVCVFLLCLSCTALIFPVCPLLYTQLIYHMYFFLHPPNKHLKTEIITSKQKLHVMNLLSYHH